MQTTIELPIAFTATDRLSLERQLDEAVGLALTRALNEGRQGILVTQHDHFSFTVDLSDEIPFGLTCEHQTW